MEVRGTYDMWNTRTWTSSACGAYYLGGGLVFLQILVVLGATDHAEIVATWGGVVPHPENEVGRTAGPWLHGGGVLCCGRRRAAGRVHL